MSFETTKTTRIALGVSLVLGCVGIGAWIYQLMAGMQVTGLDNTMIWGLSIAVFFAIIAAGAGLLILCGLSEYLGFMDAEQRKQGIAFSLAAMFAGGMLVLMDLGNPIKFVHLLTSMNFTSYTVLDFWFLLLSIVAAVIYLFMARAGRDTRVIGTIALVLSVGLIVVEGMLLANNTSHHLWASSMSVISFIAGAFLAGSALFAFIAPEHKKVLFVALIASALVMCAEVGTSLIVGTEMTRGTMLSVVAGPFAPYFYFHVVVGLVIPVILILKTDHVALASLCAIVGLAAEKLWFLLAGEAEVWGQAHHIGATLPGQQLVYVPSFVEVAITVGALSLGLFFFLVIKGLLLKKPTAR